MSDMQADTGGPGQQALREHAAEKLMAMVRHGLLRPGDSLPSEGDLSATVGVSREAIRGAVQALTRQGMIEMAPGAGGVIAQSPRWIASAPTCGDIVPGLDQYTPDEVYEARRLAEMAVARQAAIRISANLLDRLGHLVTAQAGMFDNPVAFQISDAEFHVTIYRAGGNRLLADFLSRVYEYALSLRVQAMVAPGAVRRSWEDHRLILAALASRDGEATAAAMARHLLRVHETTLAAMREP